jgi:hypothetical protein
MLTGRGQSYLASFTKAVPTFQTPLNLLIASALLKIEEIGRLGLATEETIHRARTLSMVYDDCLVSDVVHGSPDRIIEGAYAARRNAVSETRDRILTLGSILVSGQSTGGETALTAKNGVAWFIDLEDLFEQAVWRTFASQLPPKAHCLRGESYPASIIAGVSKPTANPDLVIKGEDFVLVGDVKYKDVGDKSIDSGDLYQLLVHASAYAADRAFLVYPGDKTSIVEIGDACTGVKVIRCVVDLQSITDGISEIVQKLIATRSSYLRAA